MAGIYLHIPFCARRCSYCDFFSSTRNDLKDAYVHALCNELDTRRQYIKEESIDTVYLGGGTPSQLNEKQLNQLFSHLYNIYKVKPDAEITFEANPDDLTHEYVQMLRSLPINRISIGIQTFHEERLKFYGRRHSSAQAILSVKTCQQLGFDNISIDLIYGWPGQNCQEWKKDLDIAMNLNIQHLSAYHLTYEEGTHLWNMRESKVIQETDEETSVKLYTTLTERTKEEGFEHYEISNFCQPGMYSKHNSNYWKGIPYLGCGAAAHSYDQISRQWNIASIEEYIEGIENKTPYFEREELDVYTQYNDYILTRIRTRWGINLEELKKEFGEELKNYCLRMARIHLQQKRLIEKEGILTISTDYIFISDGIISDLLWV